ncbi:RnfABCDGE type electron transport complex subunit B [Legionella israelensis]|uniref:RnfABCDGE type electron transport complex subunit B n=1 Tax=Legionella israelensis TaxID=454 RepID=A0AAX1EDQ0_9GAMM|nr:RnfABCDGE type electron transport complex subunit B [Legionella israelensis]QBR83175.1 RnfABCDGE type electron transport complex subunit B [Legionella israelensis]
MVSVKDIDALLPQTQCGECGYEGCMPYAEALAAGQAPVDRCPPGGITTLKRLASLLKIDPSPYLEAVKANTRTPAVANIREAECIGCTKCIQACPVDAVIGSGKHMHTVIPQECTGCGLCIEPCPVDCIDLLPLPEPLYDKEQARARYHARQSRLLREEQDKQRHYKEKRRLASLKADQSQDKKAKQDYILKALARVQAKKSYE